MSKISFSEAVNIIPVSESTLRRHMRSGKVSSEKDRGGRNLFDTAELARVYGDLKINGNPSLSSKPVNDGQMTDNDTPTKIVALLESQNTELKAQLEKAHTENAQLLELATSATETERTPDDPPASAQTTFLHIPTQEINSPVCSPCRPRRTAISSNSYQSPALRSPARLAVFSLGSSEAPNNPPDN